MKRFIPAALATLVIGAGLAASLDRSRANLLLTPTSGGGGGGGIAFVSSADLGNVSSGNLTANCTVGSGANRLLLVFGAGASTGADTVTGITYNSVAMTRVAVQTGGGGSARTAYLYYLLAPASGTHSVVVSQTGGNNLLFGCADYTGVNQSAQPDSFATVASGSPTTSTLATTVVAANSWVVTIGTGLNATPTVTGGTNTRRSFDNSFVTWVFGDSNAAESAGSYSMTVNWPSVGSLNINQITASFSPAGGGGGPTPHDVFLTVASSSPWTVDGTWNNASNYIEAIGGGGGGSSTNTGGSTFNNGGGGGEWRKITNQTLSGTVPFSVGAGGTAGPAGGGSNGGNGGNTTFNTSTLIANGGTGANAASSTGGGAGGTGGTGGTGNAGGAGGNQAGNVAAGGGGAGGLGGVGGSGAAGNATFGSSGGGANGGGGAGSQATTSTGGAGGASISVGSQTGAAGGAGGVTAGPTAAQAGTSGSGGGGGSLGLNAGPSKAGGAGGAGAEFDSTHGGGGGGGGGATGTLIVGDGTGLGGAGGAGGLYGGGGGGAGYGSVTESAGGAGAPGIIHIHWCSGGTGC